jgi:hypothetical protein
VSGVPSTALAVPPLPRSRTPRGRSRALHVARRSGSARGAPARGVVATAAPAKSQSQTLQTKTPRLSRAFVRTAAAGPHPHSARARRGSAPLLVEARRATPRGADARRCARPALQLFDDDLAKPKGVTCERHVLERHGSPESGDAKPCPTEALSGGAAETTSLVRRRAARPRPRRTFHTHTVCEMRSSGYRTACRRARVPARAFAPRAAG